MDPQRLKEMPGYEPPLPTANDLAAKTVRVAPGASLPEPLLLKNVLWFCRLRWIVVAIFTGFGVLCLFGGAAEGLGLRPRVAWPFVMAGIVAPINLVFSAHARRRKRSGASRGVKLNLWSQIIFDLVALTAVVHFIGSADTYILFTYLFHIVLACIFFSRPWSLIVAGLACTLYVLCVFAEQTGIVPPSSIHADASLGLAVGSDVRASVLNVASALAIWLVVWYLAAELSAMVRQRDNELAETNRRLVQAQEERARHMLRTTHELKAPFAAIHANTQLLLKGRRGVLPDGALDVMERIAAICRRLAGEIRDMLQLANLDSESRRSLRWAAVDLPGVLAWSIGQVQPTADERTVVIDQDIQPASTTGVEDHLKMLFTNLVANAVAYSHPAGHVRVHCRPGRQGQTVVVVEDDGIGIPAEKLPHIFEEYYRTQEAARHNKESSGLGLTIVRHIARTHGIRVRVQSRQGVGTRFQLWLPPPGGVPEPSHSTKETQRALLTDR